MERGRSNSFYCEQVCESGTGDRDTHMKEEMSGEERYSQKPDVSGIHSVSQCPFISPGLRVLSSLTSE